MSLWQQFLLTFVPLFIVLDAVGTLPFVLALSDTCSPKERTRMIRSATITAAIVGFFFLFLGKFILNLMGISVGSFAIEAVRAWLEKGRPALSRATASQRVDSDCGQWRSRSRGRVCLG